MSTTGACPVGSDWISPRCIQMALGALAPYLHLALVQMLRKQKSCNSNRSKLKKISQWKIISAIMILLTCAMLTQDGDHLLFLRSGSPASITSLQFILYWLHPVTWCNNLLSWHLLCRWPNQQITTVSSLHLYGPSCLLWYFSGKCLNKIIIFRMITIQICI
jgi:hypothetical protein